MLGRWCSGRSILGGLESFDFRLRRVSLCLQHVNKLIGKLAIVSEALGQGITFGLEPARLPLEFPDPVDQWTEPLVTDGLKL